MWLRLLRTATLTCTALVMGLAFAHVLELPQKMAYGFDQYARVQHTLYAYFAYVGGPLEVLAIILAVVLTVLLRRAGAPYGWTAAGTVVIAVGLAEWALVVQTANMRMADWTAGAAPADWTSVRARWEFGHLAHFLLFLTGFLLLLWPSLAPSARVPRRP